MKVKFYLIIQIICCENICCRHLLSFVHPYSFSIVMSYIHSVHSTSFYTSLQTIAAWLKRHMSHTHSAFTWQVKQWDLWESSQAAGGQQGVRFRWPPRLSHHSQHLPTVARRHQERAAAALGLTTAIGLAHCTRAAIRRISEDSPFWSEGDEDRCLHANFKLTISTHFRGSNAPDHVTMFWDTLFNQQKSAMGC